MKKPTFVVGGSYKLTWECSSRGDYDDATYDVTYVGLATDGCFAFVSSDDDEHGTHVFFSDDYLWIDDMEITPCSIAAA